MMGLSPLQHVIGGLHQTLHSVFSPADIGSIGSGAVQILVWGDQNFMNGSIVLWPNIILYFVKLNQPT